MIDKAEIRHRFRKSVESYDDHADAQKAIVRRLTALLDAYVPGVSGDILEVGCGTGLLTERLTGKYGKDGLFINDLVDVMCAKTATRCQLPPEHCLVGDIEQIAVEGCFDLIVSASTFQWLACPAETFARLSARLCPGGIMVFSTFGKENCKELRSLTGTGLTYYSLAEMTDLLSPCLEVVHAEEDYCVLEFEHPLDVLRHVKNTGVNAMNLRESWTPGRLEKFVREYKERFQTGGRCPLTYHPQYFVCKKR
ncbi:MAG: malonyl-ACP O-methyltransferase BioC [Odoribacter sp.]|nr:malonyl-ACP O-methyltransferase BioC [Odoribacter sp.]